MMQKTTSELINALRLMLIMGLVWVHFGPFPGASLDPFIGVYNPDFILTSSLNSFFVFFFLSAVPVLSIISGYLLALNGQPNYLTSLSKRARTVFLPAILWTSFWLLFAFALYSVGKNSGHFTYYDYGFSNFNVWTLVDGIFGVRTEPFAFQFWFVHDLILSILISPIIYLSIKKAPIPYFVIVGGLWISGWSPPIFFYLKVTMFFSLGIFLAQHKWQPKNFIPYGKIWILSFITLIFVRIYTPNWFEGTMPFESVFEAVLRTNGVVAVVSLAMILRERSPNIFHWLRRNSGYSFFIFATHFPVVILIKEIFAKIFGSDTMIKQLLLWIASPILTITILIVLASLLSKYANGFFRILNGQRQINTNQQDK